eukprot:TRINITY_DN16304_c0_g1_i1.p1 TRINITY_DN16304_c0_g1~~TRINITY_DN16304_c0_g1_i1.p1  ORF type:complete len:153 (-),score=25.90 TRINITY_DN16304_c0_g1_i1:79-537(-)
MRVCFQIVVAGIVQFQLSRGIAPKLPVTFGNSSVHNDTHSGDEIEPSVDLRLRGRDVLVQGLDHLQIGVFVQPLLHVHLPRVIVTLILTAKVPLNVAKITAKISIQMHIHWLTVVLRMPDMVEAMIGPTVLKTSPVMNAKEIATIMLSVLEH